jgi:hypothetical protein
MTPVQYLESTVRHSQIDVCDDYVWLKVPLGDDVFITVTTNRELNVPEVDRLLEYINAIRDGFLAREKETAGFQGREQERVA